MFPRAFFGTLALALMLTVTVSPPAYATLMTVDVQFSTQTQELGWHRGYVSGDVLLTFDPTLPQSGFPIVRDLRKNLSFRIYDNFSYAIEDSVRAFCRIIHTSAQGSLTSGSIGEGTPTRPRSITVM
jgi:hypothetical protein